VNPAARRPVSGNTQSDRHRESLTQLGRGVLQASATVIAGTDAVLYYAHVGTRSSTLAELVPDYAAFVIPVSWSSAFVINGKQVDGSSIYSPVDATVYQAYGDARTTVAVALPSEDFISALAALRGVGPDDVQLAGGAMKLPSAIMRRARHSLAMMLEEIANPAHIRSAPPESAQSLTRRAAALFTDIYLHARPPTAPRIRTATRLAKIVRKAEDRFAAARGGPVSLADLCAAAGVSQGTLYHAFMVMCDSSPMAYFKKRRLTDARLALLGAPADRGSVKSAALGAGLTHLGRFSAEYRDLFGETPTATLNRSRN